jgi:hypothetical protein
VSSVIRSATFWKDLRYAVKSVPTPPPPRALLPQPNRARDPDDTGPTSLSRRSDQQPVYEQVRGQVPYMQRLRQWHRLCTIRQLLGGEAEERIEWHELCRTKNPPTGSRRTRVYSPLQPSVFVRGRTEVTVTHVLSTSGACEMYTKSVESIASLVHWFY